MEPLSREIEVSEDGHRRALTVTRTGVGPLLTDVGSFWQFKFTVSDEWSNYTAIVKSSLSPDDLTPLFQTGDRVPLRLDSGCETGQVFDELTCECRDQLKHAMTAIERAGKGLIICIPGQDGRGRGSPFKLGTMWLQSRLGLDTVQAASLLAEGQSIDVRSFAGAIAVLKFLGCCDRVRFAVMTNNPQKLAIFTENHLSFEAVPLVIGETVHTRHHLRAKGRCLGHADLLRTSLDLA